MQWPHVVSEPYEERTQGNESHESKVKSSLSMSQSWRGVLEQTGSGNVPILIVLTTLADAFVSIFAMRRPVSLLCFIEQSSFLQLVTVLA